MNFIERHDRLARIAQFIKWEQTGTLEEFAQKCGMKKDAMVDYINILKDFAAREGAEILYNKHKKTYYFDPPGKFIDFKFKENNWLSSS